MQLPQLSIRKVAIVTGFVVLGVFFAYLILRFFFVDTADTVPVSIDDSGVSEGIDPFTGLPSTGTERRLGGTGTDPRDPVRIDLERRVDDIAQGYRTTVKQVRRGRVLDPSPSRGGRDVVYYDPSDGKFYRSSADGENVTLMTDERFFAVSSVVWSPDQDRAFIEYPDGSNIVYDFTRRSSVTFPREVVEPQFSKTSDQIVFKLDTGDPNENWLVTTSVSGGAPQYIEPLGENGSAVQVALSPTEEVVALFHQPSGARQEEVLFIGKQNENFRSFVVDGLSFRGTFSPDGSRLLYHAVSSVDSYRPRLWVVDARGTQIGLNKHDLLLLTWIDKCVFSRDNRTVYCAAPKNMSSGAGLLFGGSLITDDEFYRVDLDTGIVTKLAVPLLSTGRSVSAARVWLDDSERTLFFWDGISGEVFSMRLK